MACDCAPREDELRISPTLFLRRGSQGRLVLPMGFEKRQAALTSLNRCLKKFVKCPRKRAKKLRRKRQKRAKSPVRGKQRGRGFCRIRLSGPAERCHAGFDQLNTLLKSEPQRPDFKEICEVLLTEQQREREFTHALRKLPTTRQNRAHGEFSCLVFAGFAGGCCGDKIENLSKKATVGNVGISIVT